MDQSEISMFQRFYVISNVMPYYSYTHKAFLLLSSLWSSSRYKLDEYYNEFIRWMSWNRKYIEIQFSNIQKYLFLPNDLFEIGIADITETTINIFIQFIEKLSKSEGCYFKSHYMHSQVVFSNPIIIDHLLFEKLHPYIETLKTVQVNF